MRSEEVDVAIMGGAFSGAVAGILLRRSHPDLRVLIIEKAVEFDRKVGESTSEVAGTFLTKILNLDAYLSRNHITKHGLRMWFNSEGNECMQACSEVGGYYQVRMPTFQLDRSHLDAHLLELAVESGCELWRPATIRDVELNGIGDNTLTVKDESGERKARAKWVIDASGKAAYLARKLGQWRQLDDHPTNAVWARFRNVTDLDSYKLKSRFPEFADALPTNRNQATNHLMGRGWWCWIIPLRDGDVSAGVTYDPRIFQLPKEGTLAEKLKAHLLSHPVGREMFGEAEPIEKDTRSYSKLPYYTEQAVGEGWATVGDASGFMDPLYSQGLDYCAHTVYCVHKMIGKSLSGECVKEDLSKYNAMFRQSYFRWYEALYKGKYRYLGDMELMTAAFLLDIATYFIGPVRLVHMDTEAEYSRLPYDGRGGWLFAKFMRFYNRRLGHLAEKRWAAGVYGKRNTGERYLIKAGFTPCLKATIRHFLRGVWWWLKCEAKSLILPRVKREKVGTKAVEAVAEGRS